MKASQNVKFSIKKNDHVQVIAGREKGKTGKVLKVDAKTGRVTVEKVNMVKRHVKPTQTSPQGGIVEKELSLDYSNVALFCAKCNQGVRHSRKVVDAPAIEGKKQSGAKANKIRVCKRCKSEINAA